MSKYILLLKVNLQAILNPSKIVSSGYLKKKSSKGLAAFLVVIIFASLVFSAFSYMVMLGMELNKVNMIDVLPLMAMIAASLITLFSSLYQTQSYLFSSKDLDMLLSMPISKFVIMLSKITTMYLEYVLFTGVIIIPAGCVYYYYSNPNPLFILFYLVGWILVPLFPIIISVIIGYIIGVISTKFKRKNIGSIVVSFVLIIAVFSLSFGMEGFITNIAASAKSVQDLYFKIYFPAKFFYNSFAYYSFVDMVIFIVLSVLPFVVFVYLLSIFYLKIVTKLSATKKTSNFIYKRQKSSGVVGALYRKEFGRYMSSTIYVMNTAFGIVMLLIAAIGITFFKPEALAVMLDMPGMEKYINQGIVPIMLLMIMMTATAASSISLEGINLWIIKSAPVNVRDVFLSKILVNLTVILPITYISIGLISWSLGFGVEMIFAMVLLATFAALFTAVFGLTVNLCFPKLDAISDVAVVKQSASMFISTFAPIILVIGLSLLYVFVLSNIKFEIYLFMGSGLLLILSICCIMFLNTKGKKIFNSL